MVECLGNGIMGLLRQRGVPKVLSEKGKGAEARCHPSSPNIEAFVDKMGLV